MPFWDPCWWVEDKFKILAVVDVDNPGTVSYGLQPRAEKLEDTKCNASLDAWRPAWIWPDDGLESSSTKPLPEPVTGIIMLNHDSFSPPDKFPTSNTHIFDREMHFKNV